jgi:predicted amidophosphoribosyltransferase
MPTRKKTKEYCSECGAELKLRPASCPLCGAEVGDGSPPADTWNADAYQSNVRYLREQLHALRTANEA